MSGYSYRKKITIDKSKVVPTTFNSGTTVVKQDLLNFPVLIVLQDDDLIHRTGSCGNKISSIEGKDISFALTASPSVPLNFQLEQYDPETGTLSCWVRIALLSASGTPTLPTSLYFYYGSALLHDPFDVSGTNVWSGEFSRIWHLKPDLAPSTCKDAQSGFSSKSLTGSPDVSSSNFVNAKIGKGIRLDQHAFLQAEKDTSTAFTISAWINVQPLETDQVIIASDSLDGAFRNGYIFKINVQGDLVLEFYRSKTVSQVTVPLTANGSAWHLINITISGTQLSVLVNGIQKAGINSLRMGLPGAIRIGMDKQNTGHYSGIIDEIRIQKAVKKTEWFRTQYVNQDNPAQFYTVSEEEYNPVIFAKFTGTVSTLWNLPANWSNGVVPGPDHHIIISENRTAHTGNNEISVGKLILKSGAMIYLNGHLTINCDTKVETGAQIKLNDQSSLKFKGDVINNGSILSSLTSGKLSFTGSRNLQTLSGSGTVKVYHFENDQSSPENQLALNSVLQVFDRLQLKRGILNAGGNLTLLASPVTGTASLLPVDPPEATIYGIVQIQQYVSGGFPLPATARNWRLMASPVYNHITNGIKTYNISAYKKSMFITGPGGTVNGFDPSPLNSGTVYTHNQALNGNLSQKYTAISDIQTEIQLGKGLYVFSRGSRNEPNAYVTQIEQKPFSNPDAYYITYAGEVFTGELHMGLNNKNSRDTGDGFNLLGNPYPSPLLWGSLSKTNLSSFIWQYDPVNRDYVVNDGVNTMIPAGTAFFVRVKDGEVSGSLTFAESAKYHEETAVTTFSQIPDKRSEKNPFANNTAAGSTWPEYNMKITLGKGEFNQEYKVKFKAGMNNGIDDNDAPKIAEGFVNISSLVNDVKLAMEERNLPEKPDKIQLYTSVWDSGNYQIKIKISTALRRIMDIKLVDSNSKKEVRSIESDTVLNFAFTKEEPGNRFSIILSPKANSLTTEKKDDHILVYPNPVSDRIFIRSILPESVKTRFVITNLSGKVLYTQFLTIQQTAISIDCQGLKKGIYLVNIYPLNKSNSIKSIKIIRM